MHRPKYAHRTYQTTSGSGTDNDEDDERRMTNDTELVASLVRLCCSSRLVVYWCCARVPCLLQFRNTQPNHQASVFHVQAREKIFITYIFFLLVFNVWKANRNLKMNISLQQLHSMFDFMSKVIECSVNNSLFFFFFMFRFFSYSFGFCEWSSYGFSSYP